ncbi:MAG: hypothetical protein U9R08_03440 [Nanoarchaeota archaeon]|nr:hypothetical protein [Nanoarchaeota archaeon]
MIEFLRQKQKKRMQQLEVLGNDYLKDTLLKKKEKNVFYGKNKIALGKIVLNNGELGETYYLDISQACRIIKVGMTRGGKTFLMRAMGDRAYKAGHAVVYLTDVKDEFKSSRKPVQPEYYRFLDNYEKPQKTPVVTFRPTFFKKLREDLKELPSQNYWYSPNIKVMRKADFVTLLSASKFPFRQQNTLEMVWSRMQKWLKENKNNDVKFDFRLIEDWIEEVDDDENQSSSRSSLKMKLKPLYDSGFYEPNWERDLVKMIRDKFVPSINMESYDEVGESRFKYPEVIISLALSEIITARRNGKIPPVWFFMDEALRFVGEGEETCVLDILSRSFDLDTRYNINYDLAVQDINKLPEKLINQAKYLMVTATATIAEIQQCMKICGIGSTPQARMYRAHSIKTKLQKVKFSWAIFTREGEMHIIKPLAPLSEHMETSK